MSDNGWQITTIDVPGASATKAVAMASDGEIIGVATIQGKAEGFVYNNGTATLLEVPGASSTTPYAINASGEIVGSFTNGTGTHGFVDNAGTFTTLNYPGATYTTATGINASGEIVGSYDGTFHGTHESGAYLLIGGHYSSISASNIPISPVFAITLAEGISDAGEVVGYMENGIIDASFSYAAGTGSVIYVPGSGGTYADAINATGSVVGILLDEGGAVVAGGFLDIGGNFTTFDVLGAGFNSLGISNGGTLYGSFSPTAGTMESEGFIGTPGTFTEIPVPGALMTAISGIDAVGDLAGNVVYPITPGSAVVGPSQAVLFTRTSAVHWAGGSGGFGTAADWNPQVVPSATNDVSIDAGGTYTVTSSTSETMNSLAMVAGATLVVSAGTFTVSNGSEGGALAGSVVIDDGAVLALAGSVSNTGTIAGAGQLGDGQFSLSNTGTANANDAAALRMDLGSGHALTNSASGLVEASGAGGLVIASGTISNAGMMLAANGGTLTFQSGVVNGNNNGGVLRDGAWEASGGGTLAVTGGAVAHDAATIILSGAGSALRAGNGSIFTNLQASLTSVNKIGTLELDAGATFTAAHQLAGVGRIVLAGGTLTAPRLALDAIGRVSGSGTIAGSGGTGTLALVNSGTVDADGPAGLTIQPGGGNEVRNLPLGLIEATGGGGLNVSNGTFANYGTVLVADGATLKVQGAVSNITNNAAHVLSGGTWAAIGNGSVLALNGPAVQQLSATVVLSGLGSMLSAGTGGTFTSLEASLAGINQVGKLALDAGRSFSATHGIAGFGLISLAGGTLTMPRLAVGAGGVVRGFGTIVDTRLPVFNAGTIEANGGTLALATAVGPGSTGVFLLDAFSFLEIAADQGAGNKMRFVGAGGELVIDHTGKFGVNVGSASYTGPLIQGFVGGEKILLKDLAPAGLTPVYNATDGKLQISNGSTNVASLAFEKASLGTGSFHIGDDGFGHALLTHS